MNNSMHNFITNKMNDEISKYIYLFITVDAEGPYNNLKELITD